MENVLTLRAMDIPSSPANIMKNPLPATVPRNWAYISRGRMQVCSKNASFNSVASISFEQKITQMFKSRGELFPEEMLIIKFMIHESERTIAHMMARALRPDFVVFTNLSSLLVSPLAASIP